MGEYAKTIKTVREVLNKKYPGIEPKEDIDNLPAYILWMLEEIEKMGYIRAGRWIGYVLRGGEELGLFTNRQSRDFVREDEKVKLIMIEGMIEAIESIAERLAKRTFDSKPGPKKKPLSLEKEIPELAEMKMTILTLKRQLGFMTNEEVRPLAKELLAKRGSR